MIRNLLKWRHKSQPAPEDVTDVWNACHPHLKPLTGAQFNGQLATSPVELFAHIRLWGGMGRDGAPSL